MMEASDKAIPDLLAREGPLARENGKQHLRVDIRLGDSIRTSSDREK